MKKRLLSMFLAAAMVFSAAGISYVPAEAAGKTKVALTVADAKGTEAAKVTVDEDYVITATIADTTLDTSAVKVNLEMTDVAGLGIEGTKSASYEVATGVNVEDKVANHVDYKKFEKATVNATFNGNSASYDVVGDKESTITATPADEEAVRTAWLAMSEYIATATKEAKDSYVKVAEGAYVAIGTEKVVAETELVLDELNKKADAVDTVKAAVKLETVEAGKDQLVAFVPAGTTLAVENSVATLEENVTIKVNGFNEEELAENSLSAIKAAVNSNDKVTMINAMISLINDVIAAAEGQTITVDVTTDDYKVTSAEKEAEEAKKETEEAKKEAEEAKKEAEAANEAKAEAEKALEEAKKELAEAKEAATKAETQAKAEKEAAVKVAEDKLALAKNALAILEKNVTKVKLSVSNTTLKATWTAVPEATEYKVVVKRNGKVWKKDVRTTEANYTIENASGYKYTVTVTPVAEFDGAKYVGTAKSAKKTVEFVAPTLKATKNKKATKATIKTTTAFKATGYEIQVATNKKFNKAKTYTVKISGTKKLSKAVSLSKGNNYIRVRAYKTYNKVTVKGKWSATKTVKR